MPGLFAQSPLLLQKPEVHCWSWSQDEPLLLFGLQVRGKEFVPQKLAAGQSESPSHVAMHTRAEVSQ
jgi:hypothetical protein